MENKIIVVLTTIVIVIQAYFIGYNICDSKYKHYYDATETMLDSIDADNMLDVIMESDEYRSYIEAKEDL